MDYEHLKAHMMAFFGDKSRSAQATKDGLLDLVSEAQMLAESIPDVHEDDDDADEDGEDDR